METLIFGALTGLGPRTSGSSYLHGNTWAHIIDAH